MNVSIDNDKSIGMENIERSIVVENKRFFYLFLDDCPQILRIEDPKYIRRICLRGMFSLNMLNKRALF
jgi:hypothetical protein